MKMAPFFYALKGVDPFEHLAAEDVLLRAFEGWGMAVWVSRPCVVMGRFQNPWCEIHGPVPLLLRRQSGGGCVYQDSGNLNFAFFGDLKYFNKAMHFSLIKEAMAHLGPHLEVNDRGDLLYRRKDKIFKVSGSAFKYTRNRFLHHGTLLLKAELENLRHFLHPPSGKSTPRPSAPPPTR